MNMRAKISEISVNRVTVSRINIEGEYETTEYFCGMNGGYVRERTPDGRNPQVCDALQSTGNTLSAADGTLATVIRRELRKCLALEKRAGF